MKALRMAIPCIMVFGIAASCFSQNITDVEVKPYGAYAGGSVDTVDLATGNLFLNIPLISYPQLGKLAPLSFSIGLNNAPYSITLNGCDPYGYDYTPNRYDPSAPGS